ncbi:hypothetical protein A2837_02830 [Candidatus Kaiserbacteria bacterium RIFCSPHIGHO2_01_FULL_46_22]|uniref:NlpC/P60 domain-containing protein n=1 Tax=Candidatus Kaiserbacteria bacterium RIFCSPHIGHO2_01_FULL_46_22 TaxID=1798475 RepID=A0A1F6BXC0_9BACT|nr:MAG: hypothetical protein A2837_02830 [Candidatus Kaiserbacteria bacterium RIFCSPHIGHO2_01_FULL_46_22]
MKRKINNNRLTNEARACIGVSVYKLKADPTQAPGVVDCSSFVQWLLSLEGIALPRLAFEQLHFCNQIVFDPLEARAGDLIFRTGHQPQYLDDPTLAVGHVGFVTGDLTVIHAPSKEKGVVEDPDVLTFFSYKSAGVCLGRLG